MIERQRPHAQIRVWYWMDGNHKTPGIGMFHGTAIFAHLTPTEARAMADKLHDLADKME